MIFYAYIYIFILLVYIYFLLVYIYIHVYVIFVIQLLLRILYSGRISFIYQHLIFIIAGQFKGIFQHMNPQNKHGRDRVEMTWSFVGP